MRRKVVSRLGVAVDAECDTSKAPNLTPDSGTTFNTFNPLPIPHQVSHKLPPRLAKTIDIEDTRSGLTSKQTTQAARRPELLAGLHQRSRPVPSSLERVAGPGRLDGLVGRAGLRDQVHLEPIERRGHGPRGDTRQAARDEVA